MKVKLVGPGIPDELLIDFASLPAKGDLITLYRYSAQSILPPEYLDGPFTVKHIHWVVAGEAMPEVICDRTDDAPEPEPGCTCHATSLGKPHHYPWCQLETQQPERISNGN